MEAQSVTGACLGSTSASTFDRKLNGTCQVFARSSLNSFLGYTFSPKALSFSSKRQDTAPSALLNSREYKEKKELEKLAQGSTCDSDSDDDLCPIECVREIKTLRDLEHVIHDIAKGMGALVVVDFFRTACGSCRYIEKGFAKLCKGAGNGEASVIFLKHNVMDEYEEQSDIAEKFRIKVVPLFHFYKDGELVESFPTRDKARILETIYKHLDVDQTIEEWSDLHGLK